MDRDLKPTNVLVSADGQVHLLDFGIGRLLEDGAAGAPKTCPGDHTCALPEQLRARR